MSTKKLNGSVDILARAMRNVFTEAVEDAVEPVFELVKEVKDEVVIIHKRLDDVDSELKTINYRLDQHQKALDGIKNRP